MWWQPVALQRHQPFLCPPEEELLIVPPGGALLKWPCQSLGHPGVPEGLPLLPCCLSEDAEEACGHLLLSLVPSPPLHVPFLNIVPVSGTDTCTWWLLGTCPLTCFH